jgi:hypothetical protein
LRVPDKKLGSQPLPGSRVLDDTYDSSLVGIAIQKGRPGWLAFVSEFLDEAKRSGSMRQSIDRAGLRGFEVVTQKATNWTSPPVYLR